MDFPKYTELDGKLHLIVEGEHTECGLVIPHGNGWVKDLDPKAKVHCGKDPEPTVLDQRPLEDPESLPMASDGPTAAPVVTKDQHLADPEPEDRPQPKQGVQVPKPKGRKA